jgi:aquaglyceroporin related protein
MSISASSSSAPSLEKQSNTTAFNQSTMAIAAHDENLDHHIGVRRRTSVPAVPAFAEHGPLVDHKGPQEDVVQQEPDLAWSKIRHALREPLSEFFGTFIILMFGDGVVAQVVLSENKNGDYQSISWGWG